MIFSEDIAMKLIYAADIHDSLKGLKQLFQETDSEMYILSGDILYKAFFNYDKIIEFCTHQEEMYSISREFGFNINPFDFTTNVLRFQAKFTNLLIEKSIQYRQLFNQAAKTMKEKYQLLHKLVDKYSNSKVFFLPGNYDIDLQYTALFEKDLHRKSFIYKSLKFAGYGGAPIVTSGIPEKLAVKFHEYFQKDNNYSEPEEFFREENPDILVIHNPVYGFLDKIPGQGNIGSQGIRRFVDEYEPILVLSGHVHEDQGLIRKGKTIYFNPSNFGTVDSIYGQQLGGYFAEIQIKEDEKLVESVTLFQLNFNGVEKLIEVDCREKKLIPVYVNEIFSDKVQEFLRNGN